MGTWSNIDYDAEGRLCAVHPIALQGMPVTGYIYDASGTRVAKGNLSAWPASCPTPSNSGFTLTSSYVLGLGGEQVTEINGAGAWQHTNAYAGGKLLATYRDTNTYFDLTDWLGTKRVEYTPNGLHTSFFSLPYGDGLTPSGNAYDATEQHFTGKERDTESGNDYFEARYYSSAMGRFMSPDWSAKAEPVPYAKLDNPQSLNLYAYVLNNPLDKTDPDGHDFWDKVLNTLKGKGWVDTPRPPLAQPPAPPAAPAQNQAPSPPTPQTPQTPQTGTAQDNYEDGSRQLPSSSPGGQLLTCTTNCVGHPLTVTSTDEPTPVHPGDNPHTRQEAADIRTNSQQETNSVLQCASNCGATWAQNEYRHRSARANGGHVHIEESHRKRTRGDLPPVQ
jgi:RHS repeat-associated protein